MAPHRSAVRHLLLLFALSAFAFPHGASAQVFAPGIYQGVETGTGNTFLFRLENLPQPYAAPLLVATLFNLEGGTYRVFAGRVDRGGLNIFFSNLCAALNQSAAAQVLASPGSAFVSDPSGSFILNPALINAGNCCQVDQLDTGHLDYLCAGEHIGNLRLLRP